MKKNEEPDEIRLKTSRVSFVWEYFIVVLIIIFTILAINAFDWKFTLKPKNNSELISTYIILGLFMSAIFLTIHSEISRFIKEYIINVNDVREIERFAHKKIVVLPYSSISEVTVRTNLMGRILNYGDVFIGAFRSGSDITMKGIRNPYKIHAILEKRINLLRNRQSDFQEKAKGSKETIAD